MPSCVFAFVSPSIRTRIPRVCNAEISGSALVSRSAVEEFSRYGGQALLGGLLAKSRFGSTVNPCLKRCAHCARGKNTRQLDSDVHVCGNVEKYFSRRGIKDFFREDGGGKCNIR